jgi:hypothetical protein
LRLPSGDVAELPPVETEIAKPRLTINERAATTRAAFSEAGRPRREAIMMFSGIGL